VITIQDPVKSHELEIILVSTDSEMSDSGKRFRFWNGIRNEKLRGRLIELSSLLTLHYFIAGRLAAATA
jgi:hypothetical protein